MLSLALLSIDPFEKVSLLFFAFLIMLIALHELISGESMPSRWGGWVTTRQRTPAQYWFGFLIKLVAGLCTSRLYRV
jgi:hypothetical protein